MKHVAGLGLIASSARTLPPMVFRRPRDLADLLDILRSEPVAPVLAAGGTDLCAQFNEGLAPATLVPLDRLQALQSIRVESGVLCIGAAVTHAQGCTDPLVGGHLPGFAAAWGRIANVRIREWATIGGNLMARRTRYEMSILLTALGATLWFEGAQTVGLAPQELWRAPPPERSVLHHVAIPLGAAPTWLAYDRSLRPTATLAVCRDAAGARAVFATELLPPVALPFDPALPPAAAAAAAMAALPASFADAAASHWYLARAGEALLRRMLEQADA